MNIREKLIDGMQSETKTVYYKFKNKGWFENKKIKFILKPIIATDFITKEITKQALKEMSAGQTIEEASRVAAENFKKLFQSMGYNSGFRMLIEKSVKYPKIVDRETDLKDDEIPYKLLNIDIKLFILEKIKEISPIFQGA